MLTGELTYPKLLSLISRGVGMWIQTSDFRPLALRRRKNMCEGPGKMIISKEERVWMGVYMLSPWALGGF